MLLPRTGTMPPGPGLLTALHVVLGGVRLLCEHSVVLSPPLWALGLLSTRSRDKRARTLGLVAVGHAVVSCLALIAIALAAQLERFLSAELERTLREEAELRGGGGMVMAEQEEPRLLEAS
jgi:hypothetical protein